MVLIENELFAFASEFSSFFSLFLFNMGKPSLKQAFMLFWDC